MWLHLRHLHLAAKIHREGRIHCSHINFLDLLHGMSYVILIHVFVLSFCLWCMPPSFFNICICFHTNHLFTVCFRKFSFTFAVVKGSILLRVTTVGSGHASSFRLFRHMHPNIFLPCTVEITKSLFWIHEMGTIYYIKH